MALASVDGENRRGKSFLFLICCACAGSIPHWIVSPQRLFPAISLAFVLGFYGLRVVLRARRRSEDSFENHLDLERDFPLVDI